MIDSQSNNALDASALSHLNALNKSGESPKLGQDQSPKPHHQLNMLQKQHSFNFDASRNRGESMHSRSFVSVSKTPSNRVSFKSVNREDVLKEMRMMKA